MNGSTASASVEAAADTGGPRDLVVSVNWFGDAIMSMPALQLYRRRYPGRRLVILARGAIADLWALHRAPDRIIRYDERPSLFDPLFETLRQLSCERAWVLPNSFRSAWIAFRAGVPVRAGAAGGMRRVLLTEVMAGTPPPHRLHQAWEYIRLMTPDAVVDSLPRPELQLTDGMRAQTAEKHGQFNRPTIGMIPGAARGPSKRWPPEHFTALAKRLVRDGFDIALFGGPGDRELCGQIVAQAGTGVSNFAGSTSLSEWAVLMDGCRLIVANDSGGMHLAAALGRPLVALYGMTDPGRTGPIGKTCAVLQHSHKRSRDIARNSAEAQKCLAAIRPEAVYESAQSLLHSAVHGGEAKTGESR